MDKKTQQTIVTVIVLVVLLVSFVAKTIRERNQQQPPPPSDTQGVPAGPDTPADPSVHLALGNPSKATDDPSRTDNFLVRKPYFALSYNNDKGTPNWVAWCLKDSDLGTAKRADMFRSDPDLPNGFRRIRPNDYTGRGFDRGHMCPHSDRAATAEASEATFVMTNMVPQAPHLNQLAWNDFENYCRSLVRRKPRVAYIVAGPQGQGGEGSSGQADTIGNGHVTVPAKCWKVLVVVENGTGTADDVGRVTEKSLVLAVVMPNDQSVGHGWKQFRTSIREVETLTGYTFFDRVPAAVLDPLKTKTDGGD